MFFKSKKSVIPALRQSVVDNIPCFVSKHIVSDNQVRFKGWAIAGKKGPSHARFLINSHAPDIVNYPIPTPNLGEKFSITENASNAGFEVAVQGSLDDIFGDTGFVELEFLRDGVASERSEINRWWIFDPRREQPLPEGERAYRVVGNDSVENYLLGGATIYKRLQHAASLHFGNNFFNEGPVFDWGCGSGRVLRYFMHNNEHVEVWGGDVDKDNLSWCVESFPDAKLLALPLEPPTQLPSDFFKFVFGISVFTHLREETQIEWLKELYRITAPGGSLIMSIRGDCSLGLGQNPKLDEWVEKREEHGYLNVGVDSRINEQLDDKSYYVNCLQSKDYIRRVWSKYFEVVDIINAGGIHQDFVLLRKPL